MIILRVLLGISMVFCISNLSDGENGTLMWGLVSLEFTQGLRFWYQAGTDEVNCPSLRPYRHKADDGISEELQLRFAYLQAGEVIVLATGNIVNFGVGNVF